MPPKCTREVNTEEAQKQFLIGVYKRLWSIATIDVLDLLNLNTSSMRITVGEYSTWIHIDGQRKPVARVTPKLLTVALPSSELDGGLGIVSNVFSGDGHLNTNLAHVVSQRGILYRPDNVVYQPNSGTQEIPGCGLTYRHYGKISLKENYLAISNDSRYPYRVSGVTVTGGLTQAVDEIYNRGGLELIQGMSPEQILSLNGEGHYINSQN